MEHQVILVNELDEQIGTMEKLEVHRKALLHRAFSVFIFNSKGEMLLQQRAGDKYHSAGLWTNACCSHPLPGETTEAAAGRRLEEELGFMTPLRKIFDFIYRAGFENGLTEFEFDHVFVGRYDGTVRPDDHEVSAWVFIKPEELEQKMLDAPEQFTQWFHVAYPKVREWESRQPD